MATGFPVEQKDMQDSILMITMFFVSQLFFIN